MTKSTKITFICLCHVMNNNTSLSGTGNMTLAKPCINVTNWQEYGREEEFLRKAKVKLRPCSRTTYEFCQQNVFLFLTILHSVMNFG